MISAVLLKSPNSGELCLRWAALLQVAAPRCLNLHYNGSFCASYGKPEGERKWWKKNKCNVKRPCTHAPNRVTCTVTLAENRAKTQKMHTYCQTLTHIRCVNVGKRWSCVPSLYSLFKNVPQVRKSPEWLKRKRGSCLWFQTGKEQTAGW